MRYKRPLAERQAEMAARVAVEKERQIDQKQLARKGRRERRKQSLRKRQAEMAARVSAERERQKQMRALWNRTAAWQKRELQRVREIVKSATPAAPPAEFKRPSEAQIAAARNQSSYMLRRWDGKRKYVHTQETDEVIQQAYRLMRNYSNHRAVASAAKKLGWPKKIVLARGVTLGLAFVRAPEWSPAEDALIEDFGFLSVEGVQQKLKLAGFRRTPAAVQQRIKRLRVRRTTDGYSMNKLAELLGVARPTVSKWISRGMIQPAPTGVKYSADRERFYFSPAAIREFVLNHPEEVMLERVEKFAFLDIISGGKLCKRFL